jgi:hypothetical protein
MPTLLHVTVRNSDDEVLEFESTQPVVHIDIPEGRYLITVYCAQGEDAVAARVAGGVLH